MQRTLTLFFLCFILTLTSSAATMSSLYQGIVPVENRSQHAWEQGIKASLNQVLVKVSGNPSINTVDKLKALESDIKDWIISYRYVSKKIAKGDDQLFLVVNFNEQAIDAVLKESHQGIWGKTRPSTLLWIAITTPQGTTVLGDDPSHYVNFIRHETKRYGLPTLFPAMDIEDLTLLPVTTLKTLDSQAISDASLRYQANSMLAANIIQDGTDQWQGDWLLLYKDNQTRWHTSGSSINEVIKAGLNHLFTHFASKYTLLPADTVPTSLKLIISDVNGLKDYAAVVQYLNSLPPVTGVTVEDIAADQMSVTVRVSGGIDALKQAVEQQPNMVLDDDAKLDGGPGTRSNDEIAVYYYHWMPSNNDDF